MSMFRESRRNGRVIATGSVAILVLVMTAMLAWSSQASATAPPSHLLQEKSYPVNEEGLTYGSIADAPSDTCEPDLIEAVATNGKEGYVRNSELAVASHEYEPADQAMKAQEARTQKAAALMQKELNDRVRQDAFELADAKAILEDVPVLAEQVGDDGCAMLSAEMDVPELQQLTADDLLECYLAVDEATTCYIPVYLADGKTVIGEFPVSQM